MRYETEWTLFLFTLDAYVHVVIIDSWTVKDSTHLVQIEYVLNMKKIYFKVLP